MKTNIFPAICLSRRQISPEEHRPALSIFLHESQFHCSILILIEDILLNKWGIIIIVKIDCYLSLSCGAEDNLRENISRALALEKVEAGVIFYRLDEREAHRLGLKGSPSIRVNGEDIQPAEEGAFS